VFRWESGRRLGKKPNRPWASWCMCSVDAVSEPFREASRLTAGRTDAVEHALFSEQVRPHFAAMAHLAARIAPSAQRDDIVQEALTRAWRKRRLFNPSRGTLRSWLLAITADRARRLTRRQALPITIGAPISAPSHEDRLDLEAAMKSLPARQRLAVDCFYFVGLSVAETAIVMGCAEGTVKSALSDARTSLRDYLEGVR
jgi:RNA polymerase sigma factor (sigma-70 family)